ncbi:MAG: hypothetical protein DRO87_05385 [Candidatus Thorarchaeota archaeon]|nr:MAG: hypothetical protein DRP09_03745 [Candidatus Thorarchaeota archaeon]RLI58565.1 MAG: hypothetical protein DRO87_05385 [Candidatus Thorarchaeota archaeon]
MTDVLEWIWLAAGVAVGALFNYYLNLAPGTDPEDFAVGPQEMGVQCDCILNTIIVAGVAVIAIGASAASFQSREELYLAGGLAFFIIWIAGLVGRRKRYREWRELRETLHRALPPNQNLYGGITPVDLVFDDDEDYDEDDI